MLREGEGALLSLDGGLEVGSRACLVIGESGANWSAGIASARRHGPNLALVTQWVGEAPRHFCQRVISRLSKRLAHEILITGKIDDWVGFGHGEASSAICGHPYSITNLECF